MNPMENESVVAELLRITEGSLVLEDPRERMKGLIARPGWSTWKVLREDKNRTRRAMKNWQNKNNSKMLEKRKRWEEKRERGECPPPRERKANEDGDEEEEKEKFVPSPYDTLPYVPPYTWDEETLRERTLSLGFVEYASYLDVEPEWRRRVRVSCFPPTEEEAKEFQLHKCLRCLPQDMDTGGFFVALFKKVKPLSVRATERMHAMARESKGGLEVNADANKGEAVYEGMMDLEGSDMGPSNEIVNGIEVDGDAIMTESSTSDQIDTKPKNERETNDDSKEGNNEEDKSIQKAPTGKVGHRHKHQKKKDLSHEDFVSLDPSLWPPIVEFFGLTSTFPKDQYMARACGEAKVLYFISKSIKKNLIDRGIQDRITVINSGLKGFEKCSFQDSGVSYRLAQEGIQYVIPHMTKRFLVANMDDFYACVADGYIEFNVFSESFQKELKCLEPGSFVVALKGYEKDIAKKMFLVMWRCRGEALNCFVSKVEMEATLSKLRALGYVVKEKNPVNADEKCAEADAKSTNNTIAEDVGASS